MEQLAKDLGNPQGPAPAAGRGVRQLPQAHCQGKGADLLRRQDRTLIKEFLAVYDNLERAVAQGGDEDSPHKKGMEMIFHQFEEILQKMGVEKIDAAGQPFDPEKHSAVMHIEDETPGRKHRGRGLPAGLHPARQGAPLRRRQGGKLNCARSQLLCIK